MTQKTNHDTKKWNSKTKNQWVYWLTWVSFLIQNENLVISCIHLFMCMSINLFLHWCIYIETRMHTRTHMCAHTCAYRHTYIHVCTWVLRFDGSYVYIVIIVVTHTKYTILLWMMRMIAFIAINSGLVPLIGRHMHMYAPKHTHTHAHMERHVISHIHTRLSLSRLRTYKQIHTHIHNY